VANSFASEFATQTAPLF
jgi:chromosome segregation ATPase